MSRRFRKTIHLQEWDYSQNAVYMVTICIADRSHRLGHITAMDMIDLSDAGVMVCQELERLEEDHRQVTLDEYVVMPNHSHFLIGLNLGLYEARSVSLERIVGEFKSRTTNRYITGVKKGILPPFDRHLWQIGYYETIMHDAKWTERRREYILNNPANWRDDPEMDESARDVTKRVGDFDE